VTAFVPFFLRVHMNLQIHYSGVLCVCASGWHTKRLSLWKSLVHLSKVSIYVNELVSAIRMKSPCVIVNKQDSKNV